MNKELDRFIKDRLGDGCKIVTTDEAEKADMVVCVSAQQFYFADNVFTVCADCNGAIQHRPFVPKAPPKLCIKCAKKRLDTGGRA